MPQFLIVDHGLYLISFEPYSKSGALPCKITFEGPLHDLLKDSATMKRLNLWRCTDGLSKQLFLVVYADYFGALLPEINNRELILSNPKVWILEWPQENKQ